MGNKEGGSEASSIVDAAKDDSQDKDDGSEMGLDAAASDMMDAVHSKDAGMLKEALKSFVTMMLPDAESESEE